MPRQLRDCQVTIIGLGLMGGSLAGALRGQCRSVVGVARRAEVIEVALAQDLIDWGTTDLVEGVRGADVVVLATPVRVILRQLAEIGSLLPEGCVLIDLGSTKAQIVAEMGHLPDHVQPLGGHPMCGKEVSGIEVAEPTLYQGQTFILTPLPRTSEAALALGRELARATGAHPLVIEAQRQDFLVGTVSHLPYMLACALVATADATTSADPAAWEIVAGGFRDTSRVAGSDVTMMLDILMTNQEEVLKAVATCQAQLASLADLVGNGDEDALRDALSAIRETRLEMFP
ncbi:MAG: prephenate dehydrogenase [Anaerolineae bacterium]|jgi:prephenate dehydrogenase